MSPSKRGGPRPGAGRPSAGQTAWLQVRLSPAELERAQRIAVERGLPLSEIVRRYLRELPES